MNTLKYIFPALVFGLVLVPACSGVSDESRGTAGEIASTRQQVVATDAYPGYVHRIERSSFDPSAVDDVRLLGPATLQNRSYTQGAFQRVEGPRGIFSVNPTTGVTSASPSADVLSTFVPYGKTAAEHGAKVKEYFINAGLPADQIGNVQGGAGLTDSGAVDDWSHHTTRVSRFYTIITRSINGVPIRNSGAIASLADSGRAIHELVFWPPISKSLVDQAAGWKASLDAKATTAYRARLPADVDWTLGAGEVAIIHQSARGATGPYAVVSYETQSANGVRHFDPNGAEFHTPEEGK